MTTLLDESCHAYRVVLRKIPTQHFIKKKQGRKDLSLTDVKTETI